jgi:hypothetical protein
MLKKFKVELNLDLRENQFQSDLHQILTFVSTFKRHLEIKDFE